MQDKYGIFSTGNVYVANCSKYSADIPAPPKPVVFPDEDTLHRFVGEVLKRIEEAGGGEQESRDTPPDEETEAWLRTIEFEDGTNEFKAAQKPPTESSLERPQRKVVSTAGPKRAKNTGAAVRLAESKKTLKKRKAALEDAIGLNSAAWVAAGVGCISGALIASLALYGVEGSLPIGIAIMGGGAALGALGLATNNEVDRKAVLYREAKNEVRREHLAY